MKSRNAGIRGLIGVGSLVGFLGGWILLAHAPKPVGESTTPQVQSAPLLQSLAPQLQVGGSLPVLLPPLGLVPFRGNQNSPGFMAPTLRTHAS